MERARRNTFHLSVEITPLIDVVFLLLTFFVFALVLMVRLQITDIKLPVAAAGENLEPAPTIVLAIQQDGAYRLGDEPVPDDQVIEQLRAAMATQPDAILLIAPDEMAPAGRIFELMDMLGQAEIRDLRFLRRRAEESVAR